MSLGVSIVVPVYNKSEYLNKCIDSLLKIQEVDTEIILVDDGSKDDSLKICQEYEKNNSNIKVIQQVNQGVSVARNTGIKHSIYPYITFIDADDFVTDDFGRQISEALKYKADFYQFNYTRWYSETEHSKGNFTLEEGFHDDMTAWIAQISGLEICALCVCGGLYCRNIIENHNLQFRPNMNSGEDFLFNLHYLEHCGTYFCSNSTGYCYRCNLDSVTNNRAISHASNYEISYGAAQQYLSDHNASVENYLLFQERWIRWTLDLVVSWKRQNFSNKVIWENIIDKKYYKEIIQYSYRLPKRVKFEAWLLRYHHDLLALIYLNTVADIKKILKRYAI